MKMNQSNHHQRWTTTYWSQLCLSTASFLLIINGVLGILTNQESLINANDISARLNHELLVQSLRAQGWQKLGLGIAGLGGLIFLHGSSKNKRE